MTRWQFIFSALSVKIKIKLKTLTLLDQSDSLPAQVAAFLLKDQQGVPIDLGDTVVLMPTSGAGRAIRRELSKRGVLSPAFRLPMDSLEPVGAITASHLERGAAWTSVLDPQKREGFRALVPESVDLKSAEDRLVVASRLGAVCDQLAEAGYDPSSPELGQLLPEDALRWESFGGLYRQYLEVLAKFSLRDLNDIRFEQAENPAISAGLRRVVVASIPDLPVVVQKYLESLSGNGVAVEVLAWSPEGQADHLDDWGRPEPNWWRDHLPRLAEESLVVENDPPSEAGILLDQAAKSVEQGYAIFSAAPESSIALAAEIARRQAEAYLPEGRPLGQSEAAAILLGWESFRRYERLRDLRSLLLRPSFLSWFVAEAADDKFTPDQALQAGDLLIAQSLCRTVGAAQSWLEYAGERAQHKTRGLSQRIPMETLVRTVVSLLKKPFSPEGFLMEVFEQAGPIAAGSRPLRELSAVAESLQQFADSPLLSGLAPEMQEAALQMDIDRKRVFLPASEGVIEVQGWLEAPWSAASLKLVAGCREGALPSGTPEDAFLPDGARKTLQIACQETRFARDAYLVSCLISDRPRLLLATSRFRSQGEPNRPSRLLFGCADADLPARAKRLLKPTLPAKRSLGQAVPWVLHLPGAGRSEVEYLRVTGFKGYLQCPLRFYLGNILGLSDFNPEAREISASDYGTLIHQVLEDFGSDATARQLVHPRKIADFFDAKLEEVVRRYYGAAFPPVVRVQLESMRARLHSFASEQAEARAEGWEIIATEKAITRTDEPKLGVGPLFLTGTMDRVEVNESQGLLRVLDYKTFGQPHSPASTHLASKRLRPDVSSAACTYQGKDMFWKDLQLPLYRYMVPHIWPEHRGKQIEVGYCLLPADPDETGIEMFSLDDSEWKSALACAKEVASLIKQGVFWPPAESVDFDNFEDWFRWGDPAQVVGVDSIKRLGGAL